MGLIPGRTTLDKVKWARDEGVEGIEVSAFGQTAKELYGVAQQMKGVLPITSVCGNATLDGGRGFGFLDPDPSVRRASIEGSRAYLAFCGDVGATGQIVPPIFGPPVVPDLSPVMDSLAIEERLMVAALRVLGPFAAKHKTTTGSRWWRSGWKAMVHMANGQELRARRNGVSNLIPELLRTEDTLSLLELTTATGIPQP